MQIHSLPAGGRVKAGELEVSSITAADKAALSLQTLLYQAYNMQDEWNDIEHFLKTQWYKNTRDRFDF